MHRTTRDFWNYYDQLPPDIQRLADRNFALLKADPRHPSLHFKEVPPYYSVRVGYHYRALANPIGDNFIWFWIGRHKVYDKKT